MVWNDKRVKRCLSCKLFELARANWEWDQCKILSYCWRRRLWRKNLGIAKSRDFSSVGTSQHNDNYKDSHTIGGVKGGFGVDYVTSMMLVLVLKIMIFQFTNDENTYCGTNWRFFSWPFRGLLAWPFRWLFAGLLARLFARLLAGLLARFLAGLGGFLFHMNNIIGWVVHNFGSITTSYFTNLDVIVIIIVLLLVIARQQRVSTNSLGIYV